MRVVNMRVARHADAQCLLVADIDRGGAFAHLYGTWALLDDKERERIRGFVLNKFRGDAGLLAPGPAMLEKRTGVPTVATLPMWWHHGLPEEDGVIHPRPHDGGSRAARVITIAVVAYPRISNLDEFQPLANVSRVRLLWARSPAELAQADWVVLPGSKQTGSDLAWLRARRMDQAIAHHAERGGAVLGICGGLQMLGEALIDPQAIEGNGPGLGLLPLVTVFGPDKTVLRTTAAFGPVVGPWSALSGVAVQGYEIHQGRTVQHAGMAPGLPVMDGGLAWQNTQGNVLGVYLHGLFESPAVLQALFGAAVPTLDSVFDGLANFVDRHFDDGVLARLLQQPKG